MGENLSAYLNGTSEPNPLMKTVADHAQVTIPMLESSQSALPNEQFNSPKQTITEAGNASTLTLDVYSANQTRMEFFQGESHEIDKTLGLLIQPRLFTQPLLVLASQHDVTTIPSRTIDIIRIHSSTIAPPSMPAGILNIEEVQENTVSEESELTEDTSDIPPKCIELQTVGGWVIFLKVEVVTMGAIQDYRQALLHFYDLPVLPFRCVCGGVGFVNPANICRITIRPRFEGAPANALPAGFLRSTSR